MVELRVNLSKIKLENPLMNASGILGLTSQSLILMAEARVGAIVTKSIGLKPRLGNPNPTVVEAPCGLINSMGLPNPGVESFKVELEEALPKIGKPLIVSVFGFKPEEYSEVVRKLDELPLVGFELNVSCPHVGEVGVELGSKPGNIKEVVKAAKAATDKPVFVKLSPNVSDFACLARAAEQAEADGITAINTVKAMAVDIESGKPILAGVFGGFSGPAIKPIALRCVYEAYEAVDLPVIGCGGIASWMDAVEFFMAGASAIQVGTAIVHHGLKVFEQIVEGLNSYLKSQGLKNLKELIGKAHRRQTH
jgi:dihydroorotate dehydrogenase (NAD+) catalytic subunit